MSASQMIRRTTVEASLRKQVANLESAIEEFQLGDRLDQGDGLIIWCRGRMLEELCKDFGVDALSIGLPDWRSILKL